MRFTSRGILFVVLGLCVACATPRSAAPTTAVPTRAVASSTAVPAHTPVTLHFWEQEDERGRMAVLYPLIEEFRRANPDVAVEVRHYASEELRSQLQRLTGGDVEPDVVRLPGDFVPLLDPLSFQPLSELLSAEQMAAFLPGALTQAQLDGVTWGVPDYVAGQLVLLYNKRLLSQPPATTADLIRLARERTDVAQGAWGLAFNAQDPLWLIPWLRGMGAELHDGAGPIDAQAVASALHFMYELAAQGVMPSGCDARVARDLFVRGKAAMLIDGEWAIAGYSQEGIDLGVAPLPQVSETGRWPAPALEGRYYVAARRNAREEVEAIHRFIAFMSGPRAQEMWLTQMGRWPSLAQIMQSSSAQQDPLRAGAMAQLLSAAGIPATPANRCLQDAAHGALQQMWTGLVQPETAADAMVREMLTCSEGSANRP